MPRYRLTLEYDGGPFVGTIDLTTGVITPIVTGLSGPGGLVFVDTTPHEGNGQAGGDSCRDRESDSHYRGLCARSRQVI